MMELKMHSDLPFAAYNIRKGRARSNISSDIQGSIIASLNAAG